MRKVKKLSLISIAFFFILVGCGNADAEYNESVQSLSSQILENSTKAEEITNEYSRIWRHSIESRVAIPIPEVEQVTGLDEEIIREHFVINTADNVPEEFSLNVHSLNSYFESTGDLDDLRETAEEIKEEVSNLNNPPEDFEQVYDELLDMFTYSEEYVSLALSPDGSLQSFTEKRNDLSSEILNLSQRIDVLLPNEN